MTQIPSSAPSWLARRTAGLGTPHIGPAFPEEIGGGGAFCETSNHLKLMHKHGNVGKTIMSNPYLDGLHQPFVVIWQMVYYCFTTHYSTFSYEDG